MPGLPATFAESHHVKINHMITLFSNLCRANISRWLIENKRHVKIQHVTQANTSNVQFGGVNIDSENDFENIDIQKKMTMGPRKPPKSYSERTANKKEPPVYIQYSIEHLIIGDSIIQGINENRFHKNFGTKVVSLRGKGTFEVHQYLDQVLFKRGNPKNIIICTRSNDIKKLTIDEMENKYEELIEFVKNKFSTSKIIKLWL